MFPIVKRQAGIPLGIALLLGACAGAEPGTRDDVVDTPAAPRQEPLAERTRSGLPPAGGVANLVSTLDRDLNFGQTTVSRVRLDDTVDCTGPEPCVVAGGHHTAEVEYSYFSPYPGIGEEPASGKVLRFLTYMMTGLYLEPQRRSRPHEVKCRATLSFAAEPGADYRLGADGASSPVPEIFVEHSASGTRIASAVCQ
jgi:hypothetical protein